MVSIPYNIYNSRMETGKIISWLFVAAMSGLVVFLYLHMADDVIGGVFFGLIAVIVLFRMARDGVPASEALANRTDFSDRVTVQGGILSYADGKHEWYDSINHFDGVMWRVEKSVKRSDEHVLELVHLKNPARTIPLFRSQSEYGVRSRWVEAARAYRLPALRELNDGKVIRRMPEDLDKSMRDMVRAGRMDNAFELKDDVPHGISWRHAKDTQTIRVRKARWPFLLGLVPVIFLAFMLPNDPLTAKLLIIGVPAFVLVIWMMLDYRIDVSTKGITVRRALGIIALPGRHLPLDRVMDVVQIGGVTTSIQLEADDRSFKIGPLRINMVTWLRKFLVSALVNAP